MNNISQNLISEKIKLIYEYNNSSPLFARVAASEIDYGNILDAIKILEEGIKNYPTYPTPFFILALAYAYSGKEEEAKKYLDTGCTLLGSTESLEIFSKRINEIIEERNSLTEAKRPNFFKEDEPEVQSAFYDNIENKLDQLAEKLSKAKIIPKNADEIPNQITEFTGKKIVSETLADIYLSQKNYNEALKAYKELIMSRPERAHVYTQKITEIKNTLNK